MRARLTICLMGLLAAGAPHAVALAQPGVLLHGRSSIFFRDHSAELGSEERELVSQLALRIQALSVSQTIANGPQPVVVVTGHCNLPESLVDGKGKPAGADAGKTLSLRRAEAIRKALYESGVPTSVTVNAVGVGFASPDERETLSAEDRKDLPDNFSAYGRTLNRNVSIAF